MSRDKTYLKKNSKHQLMLNKVFTVSLRRLACTRNAIWTWIRCRVIMKLRKKKEKKRCWSHSKSAGYSVRMELTKAVEKASLGMRNCRKQNSPFINILQIVELECQSWLFKLGVSLSHEVQPNIYDYGSVVKDHKSGSERRVEEVNKGNWINSKIVHVFCCCFFQWREEQQL